MIYLTVLLFVKEGKEKIFQDYEDKVLPLLSKYNGDLIYRLRPQDESYVSATKEKPYEIHFLSFKSEEDLEDYSEDETRTSFGYLAKDAIKTVFVIQGEKL